MELYGTAFECMELYGSESLRKELNGTEFNRKEVNSNERNSSELNLNANFVGTQFSFQLMFGTIFLCSKCSELFFCLAHVFLYFLICCADGNPSGRNKTNMKLTLGFAFSSIFGVL